MEWAPQHRDFAFRPWDRSEEHLLWSRVARRRYCGGAELARWKRFIYKRFCHIQSSTRKEIFVVFLFVGQIRAMARTGIITKFNYAGNNLHIRSLNDLCTRKILNDTTRDKIGDEYSSRVNESFERMARDWIVMNGGAMREVWMNGDDKRAE